MFGTKEVCVEHIYSSETRIGRMVYCVHYRGKRLGRSEGKGSLSHCPAGVSVIMKILIGQGECLSVYFPSMHNLIPYE